MKIWLDDEREMPEEFDVHVHDLEELQEFLKEHEGEITLMSFDNDLGEGKREGWEIMQWFAREHPDRYPFEARVHSANGPAAERMEAFDANFRKHVRGEDGETRAERSRSMRNRRR